MADNLTGARWRGHPILAVNRVRLRRGAVPVAQDSFHDPASSFQSIANTANPGHRHDPERFGERGFDHPREIAGRCHATIARVIFTLS